MTSYFAYNKHDACQTNFIHSCQDSTEEVHRRPCFYATKYNGENEKKPTVETDAFGFP
jgi:hypothetical protein